MVVKAPGITVPKPVRRKYRAEPAPLARYPNRPAVGSSNGPQRTTGRCGGPQASCYGMIAAKALGECEKDLGEALLRRHNESGE